MSWKPLLGQSTIIEGVRDLDKKVVEGIGNATANISSYLSARGTAENTATGFGRIVYELFGGISRTIKWVMLLGIIILILYFWRHHINAICQKTIDSSQNKIKKKCLNLLLSPADYKLQ